MTDQALHVVEHQRIAVAQVDDGREVGHEDLVELATPRV
jgi:hypothetical protein